MEILQSLVSLVLKLSATSSVLRKTNTDSRDAWVHD